MRACQCWLLVLLVIPLVARCSAAQSEFTIVVLPDTQLYAANYPEIFRAQTQWIADNHTEQNIQFVINEGDIVDHAEDPAQWAVAESAANILDAAGVPYAWAIGNHDYDNEKPSARSAIAYNSHFGVARYSRFSWYKESFPAGSNENFYAVFSASAQKYLVMALEMHPRDSVVAWATSVVDTHADHKVIIVTHSYMFADDSRVDLCDTNDLPPDSGSYGEPLWEKFISQHANIMMVVSGHIPGVGHRADLGANGNVVNQMLADYQGNPSGGNGYMRLLKFRPALNQVEVTTYSPWLKSFLVDAKNQFVLSLAGANPLSTGSGLLTGRVRASRPTCAAVAGATVSAGGKSVQTDATGFFSMTLAAPSLYDVIATAPGWTSTFLKRMTASGYATETDFYPTCVIKQIDPSVTLCSPASNVPLPSPVRVVAIATSTSPVKLMEVWVDGIKAYSTLASQIDTKLVMAAGAHRLTALGKNSLGAVFKTTITINVVGSPTTCSLPPGVLAVNICAPTNGATVASPVNVIAATSSTLPATTLEVWVDGVKRFQTNGITLNTVLVMSPGLHRLVVLANAGGAIVKQVESITVK